MIYIWLIRDDLQTQSFYVTLYLWRLLLWCKKVWTNFGSLQNWPELYIATLADVLPVSANIVSSIMTDQSCFNHFTWTILFPLCFRHFHRPKWPLLRRKRLNDHTAYWKSATKENGYVPLGLFALAWFTVHESDQILFAVAKINRIKIFIFISMTCLSYLIRAVASCCQECQKLDAFAGNWGKSSSL